MTYSNKFVFCVLVNGRPQKELANGQISLPFGVEYALRLRNKNNRRAVVEIWIDGENVSGGGYVVNAHDYVDIKRHHDIDRAFKFVSLDSEDAIEHGKNGPNHDKVKGTIEARFRLEKERPRVIYRDVHHDHHHHHHDQYHPRPRPWPYPPIWFNNDKPDDGGVWSSGQIKSDMLYGSSNSTDGAEMTCSTGGSQSISAPIKSLRSRSRRGDVETCNFTAPEPLQDGCTVEGYSTGQSFHTVHIDLESAETCLKLFLVGFEEDVEEDFEEVVAVLETKRKKRRTVKDNKVSDLQNENQRLRQELEDLKKTENLESKNKQLEAEIEKERAKRKPARKKATKKS